MAPPSVTLRVRIPRDSFDLTKTVQFRQNSTVDEACVTIREKVVEVQQEAQSNNAKDFGLFLPDAFNPDDDRRGLWMDGKKTLESYKLKDGDMILYKSRFRRLQIRTMDGTRKTLVIDDAQSIRDLMQVICERMGIANSDEYGLIREIDDQERVATLRSKTPGGTLSRDDEKMNKLKRKWHTDDDVNWLDSSKTLREQGIQEREVLLLKRRLFYSDQNIDGRDPVQLNLLYVQLKEAILNGSHPVTQEQAVELSGFQCHIQYGAHDPAKQKSGSLDLREFLPEEYRKVKGIEKKIFLAQKNCQTSTEIEAKLKYVNFCRSLETYGINFFLVKEKMTSKNKLIPRLFGVSKHSVYSVDQKTKQILKKWPLTSVKKWAATVHGFTLDFGGYSDRAISAKTTEGEAITKLISAYIDLILKKQKPKDIVDADGEEQQAIIEQCVEQKCVTSIGHLDMPDASFSSREGSVIMPVSGFATQSAARPVSRGSLASEPLVAATVMDLSQASAARIGQVGYRVHELPTAQRALITSVRENVGVIQMAKSGLDEPDEYVPIGKDMASRRYLEQKSELSRANISSNLTSASAATADLLRTTTMDDGDDVYMIVGSAVHTIATNVEHILTDVKAVVSLQDQQQRQFGDAGNRPLLDKDALLNAARHLADAFSDLLSAAQPLDPNTPDRERQEAARRKRLLEGIDEISGICQYLIAALQEDCVEDGGGSGSGGGGGSEEMARFKEQLVLLAQDVAHRAAQLIGRAKTLSQRLEDPGHQEVLIGSATYAGVNTQRLVATAKVVAPVAQQPACQAQLLEAAKCVTRSVQELLATASDVAPPSEEPLVEEIADDVQQVHNAVDALERHISAGPLSGAQDSAVREIDQVTAALADSAGDSVAMAKYAQKAARHTAQLVASLKAQAEAQKDEAQQRKLLTAAKDLADATARVIQSAKAVASQPDSVAHQSDLKEAADSLRQLINTVGESVIKSRVIKSLQYAAQIAIIAATELVNTAQGAAKKSRASNYQLTQDCKTVAELIPRLILSVRAVRRDPEDPVAQLELIGSCQHFLPPCQELVNSSRIMQPTVSDGALQRSLNSSVNQLQNALKELRTAIDSGNSVVRHLDLDYALEQVRRLRHDLADLERDLQDGPILPLPGDSLVDSTIQLTQSQKSVNQEAQTAANGCLEGNTDQCGSRAKELSNHLKDVLEAMRCLLAFSGGERAGRQAELEQAILDDTGRVLDCAQEYITALRQYCLQPTRPANQLNQLNPEAYKQLIALKSDLAGALAALSNHVPGARQVDNVIRLITMRQHQLLLSGNPAAATASADVDETPIVPVASSHDYGALQTEFTSAAVNLNQATGDLVHSSSAGNSQGLVNSTVQFGECYDNFVDTGANLVRATEEPLSRQTLAQGLSHVSEKSSHMLLAARSVCQDPSATQAKLNLQAAARLVTESINNMIAVVTCNEESPEEKACDSALRRLQSVRPAVRHATRHAASSDGYYPSLSAIIGQTESLAESMSEIANCSVDANSQGFCEYVQLFADSVHKAVAYHTAQCVYLVGVADPASLPGRRPLIDADLIRAHLEAIRKACAGAKPFEPDRKPPKSIAPNSQGSRTKVTIYRTAQAITKATEAIVSHCKQAKERANHQPGGEIIGKRVFQLVMEVAQATSSLVKAIREMENDFEALQPVFDDLSTQLCHAIERLHSLAGSPECAGLSAQISESGLRAQEPLVACSDGLTEAAILLVKAARHLSARRNDSRMYESYSSSSKAVSDAVKLLVTTIRDMAPGRKEVTEALEAVRAAQNELQAIELDGRATLGSHQHGEGSGNACLQQMTTTAGYISELLPSIEAAAHSEPETLAHLASDLSSYLTALKDACVGCLQCAPPQDQDTLFDQTKTVLEAAENFLEGCRQTGGNPDAVNAREGLREARANLEEVCQELLASLSAATASRGDFSFLVEAIERDMDWVESPYGELALSPSLSLVDFQTRVVRICAELRRTHQDLCSSTNTGDGTLHDPQLLHQLAEQYRALVAESRGAMATCRNADTERRMSRALLDIGRDCIDTVRLCEALPSPDHADQLVMTLQPQMAEHLAELLSPLQASHRGTQACINAANTVSGIISDLDTTIMFASAGTLNAMDESAFERHRDKILHTARALVEDTKKLVAGAGSNQEDLAKSAQDAVESVTRLTETVKFGAASLGTEQSDAQVMLINAARDVASALSEMISATKFAYGRQANDPSIGTLKDSAKNLVSNVTSLLKTVKTVEDESCRGTRALEAAIEAVNQELKLYNGVDLPEDRKVVTPEDLETLKNPIITGTSHVMHAANSGKQSDVMVAANTSRKAVTDLLSGVKLACSLFSQQNAAQQQQQQQSQSAAADADHASPSGTGRFVEGLDEPSYRLYMTARDLCHCYLSLMEMLLEVVRSPSQAGRAKMASLSRQVAEALQELNAVIQSLKVGPKLVMYFRPNAPQSAAKLANRTSIRFAGVSELDGRPSSGAAGDSEDSAERAQAEVGQAVSQVEDVLKRLNDLKLGSGTNPGPSTAAATVSSNRKVGLGLAPVGCVFFSVPGFFAGPNFSISARTSIPPPSSKSVPKYKTFQVIRGRAVSFQSLPPPVAPKPVGIAKRPRPSGAREPLRQMSAPEADSSQPVDNNGDASTTPKPPSDNQQPILDSAMGIADAIAKLLRYAQLAQKELALKSAAENSAEGFESGVTQAPWSQAFVTAAKHVAAAVHHLCETANAVAQRRSTEERLISASKQVAASTAQLLVECRVRADPHSETTRRLQEAGQAVKRATERLVAQAQSAIDRSEEENRLQLGDSMVHSVKMLIEARESIFQKQRELDDMRKKYQGAWSEHQSRYPELYEEK